MKRYTVLAAGLILAACSGAANRPVTAVLAGAPPGDGYQIGGSIDAVALDAASGTLTVRGWHMLTPKTGKPELQIYAPGAASVSAVIQSERPDVVAAVGDKDLKNAGFEVTLQIAPGKTINELCITFEDAHYDKRLMNPISPDQIRCTSKGQ